MQSFTLYNFLTKNESLGDLSFKFGDISSEG